MKAIVLAIGFFAICSTVTSAQLPSDKDLLEKLQKGPDKTKALEAVLKKPDDLSPSILHAGMLVAIHEKRIEDGAFLLYAGLFRADFDMECFPPKGLAGVGPFIVNSVTAQLLVPTLTRAAMNDPVAFAKMIDRLKKWSPRLSKDYHPGYDFKEQKSEKTALEATKAKRAQVIRVLTDSSTLLNDAEYFAAYRVNQAFKHASEDKRPTKEQYEKATKTMKRIENEKGIKASPVE
jgi:hypothetical protein